MTAIIGILNKTTVAIAADSAATVSSGTTEKVYNHAHKVFNLCLNTPVAVCIYSSSAFMGIPWETIIKMYRSDSDTRPMDDLFDYGTHFIEYLKAKFLTKVEAEDEKDGITALSRHLGKIIWKKFENNIDPVAFVEENSAQRNEIFNSKLKETILPSSKSQILTNEILHDFEDYTIEAFLATFDETVRNSANNFFKSYSIEINEENTGVFIELVFEVVRRKLLLETFTGIVFSGFGTNDLMPKLNSFKVGYVVDRRIRYVADKEQYTISNRLPSAIVPFAQTDMVMGFLSGLDPAIESEIPKLVKNAVNEIDGKYVKSLKKAEATTATDENIEEEFIEQLSSKIMNKIAERCFYKNYQPILTTLRTLSKEDLAEMAESLINLTYLKRRVTFTQESVGGPVDVAVVTKGDGFVWIKRKHYFTPELNLNYLAAVLKNHTRS